MRETNPSPGSDEPTASTIAAGKKTPEAAAAPPPKPAPAPKAPASAPKAPPAPAPAPAPSPTSFANYTKAMKDALGYRE
jgi:hypothetical protein